MRSRHGSDAAEPSAIDAVEGHGAHPPRTRERTWPRALGIALVLLGVAPGSALAQIGGCTPDFGDGVHLDLETTLGTIPLVLYPNMAPNTVANFQGYVDRGDYDLTLVHRSVTGFVIQGGGFRSVSGVFSAIPTQPTVDNEACLSNTRGTIAMARSAGNPDSATSQWFINLVDNTNLDSVDGGFTAFGRVAGGGMATADAIAALPIFDTAGTLELPFNQIFRSLPLLSAPVDPPAGYGCHREDPDFGLASETSNLFIADPLRNGSAVVPFLFDPQCDGSGATGPPSVPCDPTSGRDVFAIDLFAQTSNFVRIPMSCDALAESEVSLAARRAGTIPQLHTLRVEVLSVPEPKASAAAAAVLAMFGAHALRTRRSQRTL